VTISERFWMRVRKSLGCWEWSGGLYGNKYGRFWVPRPAVPRSRLAHRVSWELEYGSIPRGMLVLHHCDNRKCVRPSHLFLGTYQDNVDDMDAKGRGRRGRFPGESNRRSTLTTSQVVEIRRRFSSGERQADIAKDMGITQSHVSQLGRGLVWKHVPMEGV